MKRTVFIGLVGITLALAASAIAAEVMLYTPAQGTITKYRVVVKNTGEIISSEATASDGSPVSDELITTLRQAFTRGLNRTTTTDSIETVLEVQSDGTRITRIDSITGSRNASGTTASRKYTQTLAYKPDGQVEVREFKFDTTNLDAASADALTQTAKNLKKLVATQLDGVYGIPLELGQSYEVTNQVQSLLFSDSPVEIASTTTRTFQGRDNQGRNMFDVVSMTPTFQFDNVISGLSKPAKFVFGISNTTGTMHYLSDGRIERGTSQTNVQVNFEAAFLLENGIECSFRATVDFKVETMTETVF
jgi:hypothetical protein